MDWQPISTAPKDGDDVLLFWWYYYPGDKAPTVGWTVCWWNGEGWEGDEGVYSAGLFSHWMRPQSPPIPPWNSRMRGFQFPDSPSRKRPARRPA